MNTKEQYIYDIMNHKIKTFRGHILYYACKILRIWKTREEIEAYLNKVYDKKHSY